MRPFLFLFTLISILNASAEVIKPTEKILLVTVDDIGSIAVNNDPVSSDILANYILERLFKSYMGTGEMHNRIKLEKADNNVPDLITEAIVMEIKEGQKKALTSLCLSKYKQLFSDLDKKKQEKLLKQFPVLFQTDFY
jgi:hypothetical protein